MIDIAEHRRALMRENLAQLDDRINWIREECIILYLNSFIGDKGEQISAYLFSNITHIKHYTVTNVLNRKVSLGAYQQNRWCCCILLHWDRIVDELKKRHIAENKKFEKNLFEKNFKEAFSQCITYAEDLNIINGLEEKVEKYQRRFAPNK